jgi:hypothetical protein
MSRMGAQVSLETRIVDITGRSGLPDGAWHAMVSMYEGLEGLPAPRYGAPGALDWMYWPGTIRSMIDAQARCAKAREVYATMPPVYQAHVMVGPSGEAARFRAAMKGGAR